MTIGYEYDSFVPDVIVLCGGCALSRVGLVYYNSNHIEMMTDYKSFDNYSLAYFTYWYYPRIDYNHWLTPSPTNPLILVPTQERAIIDYLRCEKHCDEGILIEALRTYIDECDNNYSKLYEVSDFYHVDRKVVDYWINEAINYEEV